MKIKGANNQWKW